MQAGRGHHKLAKRSAVYRKGISYSRQVPRALQRMRSSAQDFQENPPVIVNSFPKSGTHLLLQIVRSFPGIRDYGSFIATTPSLTMRERTPSKITSLIKRATPGESVGAHLFHSNIVENAILSTNSIHYFIYRDIRDVIVSEAHYLTDMNKWHRLHPYISSLPSLEARIQALITGVDRKTAGVDYPDIATRFLNYAPWISNSNVCALRFEDLTGDTTDAALRKICTFFDDRSGLETDVEDLVKKSLAAIAPERSHTFRSGKTNEWKSNFTPANLVCFHNVVGDRLKDFGYTD